jgi:hypothetical protein
MLKKLTIMILILISFLFLVMCETTPKPTTFSLTVNTTPLNSGVVEVSIDGEVINGDNGEYTIEDGKEVTLTATPTAPYNTVTWSGAGLSGNELTKEITITQDTVVTATFTQVATEYTLTVNIVNDGSVLVESGGNEVTGTVIDADTTEYIIDANTEATLTATPGTTNNHVVWSGDIVGTELVKTITMDSDKEVTATFSYVDVTYSLTLNTTGDGSVEIIADGSPITPVGNVYTIIEDQFVTINATFPGTNDMVEFSGDVKTNGFIYQEFIMDGDKTINADFTTSTSLYDKILVVNHLNGDIYMAATQSTTPTDIVIFKNGIPFGNTLNLPANFGSFLTVFLYDLGVSADGTIAYLAGGYKETGAVWHKGYWNTDTGDFTEPNPTETGFASMYSFISPNTYVNKLANGLFSVYVDGAEITLDLPTDATLRDVGHIRTNGTDTYIVGTYNDINSKIHPIVWNGDGSIDFDVDYVTVENNYETIIGPTIYDNAFDVNTDGSYVFVVPKMKRLPDIDSNIFYDTLLIKKDSLGNHTTTLLEDDDFAGSADTPYSHYGVYYNNIFYIGGYHKVGVNMPFIWAVESDGTITKIAYPSDDLNDFPGPPTNEKIYGFGFLGNVVHTFLANSGYYDGKNFITEFKK